MAGEIPPRFTDLPVSKLSEGPPARYQLITKKESLDGRDEAESRLRRWTVGEKNPVNPNKTILLVGETGAGKSTMINAMVNYVMGVKWEDKVWYEIVQPDKKLSAKRLASEIKVYEIFGFEDRKVSYTLTIINIRHGDKAIRDALEKKNNVALQLYDFFTCETEIKEIYAVGIVMTESTMILSELFELIYNSLVSLFGKDIEKNIVALITHSNGMSAHNALQVLDDAAIKCAKDENNEPVHFMFQNVQHTVISAKNLNHSERYWGMTEEGLEGFFNFIGLTDPRKPYIENLKKKMVCFQNAEQNSQRFTDFPVSKLSEGPPARYQLITKKESLDGRDEADSRLRRWTVGEKNPVKPNKTILLVGETGAGKSTMINAMVNYVMGVEWEDKVWFEIVEQDKKLPAKRLTSEINVYEIFGFEDRKAPYTLTIIDTSGHMDTENPGDRNKQNDFPRQLHDLFMCKKEIQEIDAVGIVMTESTLTLSEHLKLIYNSVVSLFGKDIEKNIVALITHSNGMSAHNTLQVLEDAKIKFAKNQKKKPVHFMFQNVQDNTITQENQPNSRFYWDLTNKSMAELIGFLVCASPKIPYMGNVQNRMISCNRAGEMSLRFTDLPVSKLSEGPPARYQLLTNKESLDGRGEVDSRLRRWTVGERDPTKPNKTILLVGETGAGKSTMINAMVDYVMGVEWEDKVWYEIVVEGEHQQTMSQTADVTVYEIFGFEEVKVPYSVTIIDTPGFGATDGNDHDEMITQTLHDLFRCSKGIQEIDAVGLVLKATENRLSDRLKYIFDAVVSLFGKDLENIIVALLTNSNGRSSTNALQALEVAKIKCAKTESNKPVNFLFDNCQTDSITEEDAHLSQSSWNITKRGLNGLFCFVDKGSSKKLNTTLDVLTERIRLKACIGNLHDRIELIEMKQTEIRQIQNALEKQKPVMQTKQKVLDEILEKLKSLRENKESGQENQEYIADAIKKHQEIIEKHKQEMEKNRNFTIEVDEPYKKKITIRNSWDDKAVCCTVCQETCHYPGCTLAINPWWCEVMKGGKCTSCTKKCDHTLHVKVKWRFVNKTRRVAMTLQNVKERYEQNKKTIQETENKLENTIQQKEKQELSSQIKQLEADCKTCENEIRERESILINMKVEMKTLQEDKARWVEEAYQHVAKLQEISLNTSSMSTYIYLDFLVEKMKEKGDMEKVQRLEDIQKQCEEGRKDGIHYMAQRAGKNMWGKCKSLKSKFESRNQEDLE